MTLAAVLALVFNVSVNAPPAYFAGLHRPLATQLTVPQESGPVILIVVDAMRPDRLSPYGSERQTTPHLSRLADDGVIFTNYFVNGNWTRPSTASMLTGLLPATHGVEHDRDRLADDYATLAEILDGAGVPTGAVVGNGNAGSAFGLARGFQFYADTVKHWRGLPSADQVVKLAVPFVTKYRNQRFFLMLFLVDPHDPYHAPAPYENMFVTDPAVALVRSPHWEAKLYSAAQVQRMQATYDGALRYTDSAIGRLMDTLRELGIYEKTTIIVTSDHGEAFGEHGEFLHSHHLYDEIIRAPLILRAPGMSARGVQHGGLFQSLDLLPTLATYLGAKVVNPVPGLDIFQRLQRPTDSIARSVICEFNNFGIHRRSIRTIDKKVIFEAPANESEFMATVGDKSLLPSVSFDKERWQAYDLVLDPFEKTNLYSAETLRDPAWQTLQKQLQQMPPFDARRSRTPVAKRVDQETYQDLKSLGYVQ